GTQEPPPHQANQLHKRLVVILQGDQVESGDLQVPDVLPGRPGVRNARHPGQLVIEARWQRCPAHKVGQACNPSCAKNPTHLRRSRGLVREGAERALANDRVECSVGTGQPLSVTRAEAHSTPQGSPGTVVTGGVVTRGVVTGGVVTGAPDVPGAVV